MPNLINGLELRNNFIKVLLVLKLALFLMMIYIYIYMCIYMMPIEFEKYKLYIYTLYISYTESLYSNEKMF